VPARRPGRSASGIDGLHSWTLESRADGGTRIVTEESWSGAPVDADPEGMRAALDQSPAAWLRDLKKAAEKAAQPLRADAPGTRSRPRPRWP